MENVPFNHPHTLISPNLFTIYNASAGSGKTYTLVREYLLLLLKAKKQDAYRNILAITFTNKAVAEMKTRVVSSLQALACEECPEDYENLMKDLMELTGFSEDKIKSRAQKVLKSILHNYAHFDISTIDRFTQKIIRTFARDLGIPVNFEVELNTLQILQEAVDRLINRAGEDKVLTKVLIDFTLSKTDDDKSWDISRDLFNFSRILLHENHQKFVDAIKGKTLEAYKLFAKKLRSQLEHVEERISSLEINFFQLISDHDLERLDFKSGYLYDYFIKLREKNFKINFGAKWQENINDEKLYSAKVSPHKKALLDEHQQEIALFFKNSRAAIYRREYLKEILSALTPLSLLSEIASEIEHIKKERSLVLISDFNPTISAQVKDQPAPFIYERLGERYRNYFIDEFQDTSEMQWQNIIPLIDHTLSSQAENNEHSSLTLVGDAKQSIYRFRGGKAEQFIALYNEENPFGISKSVLNLPYNFRSAKEIVDFNNSFFKYLAGKFNNPSYGELFEKSAQLPKKDSSGYVNISFIEAQNSEEEMTLHPQKVLDIIKEVEERGMLKSDICVLTRTRKQSFAIANFLSEQGISIISSESLLVSNSPEVNFLNTLLEFSINPDDRNLKWELLNFLVRRLNPRDPHGVIATNLDKNPSAFFEWLKDYEINFDLREIKERTLYEAVEYMIDCFSLVEKSDAYVQSYLDFVFEKSTKHSPGINEFLELWEQNKEKLSIISPGGDDAVQIMTIHKSKGLEFPVVIYPFANTKIKDTSKESLWLPLSGELADIPYCYFKASQKMLNWGEYESSAYQELLDQIEFDAINILYVAFTRASKKLYILSCYELKNGEECEDRVSGLLIGFLKSQHKWNEGEIYEFGENEPIERKKQVQNSIAPEKPYRFSTRSRIVKMVTRTGSLWGSPQEEAINTGNLVHNILSETGTVKDLPLAMQKFTPANFSVQQKEKLEQLISGVILHPQLRHYFSEEAIAYRERDIISPTGEILRPDRLNIEGGAVTIIDYKTGKFQPAHREQMEQYSAILSAMGFEVRKKILIYINEEVNISFE